MYYPNITDILNRIINNIYHTREIPFDIINEWLLYLINNNVVIDFDEYIKLLQVIKNIIKKHIRCNMVQEQNIFDGIFICRQIDDIQYEYNLVKKNEKIYTIT